MRGTSLHKTKRQQFRQVGQLFDIFKDVLLLYTVDGDGRRKVLHM
jgi:hypothetical protein